MSLLRPDDRSSRARSSSKSGTRDRSRSRSNVRAPKVPSPPSATAAPATRYAYPTAATASVIMPSMPAFDDHASGSPYEIRSPDHASRKGSSYFPNSTGVPYPTTGSMVPFPTDDGFTMGDWTDFPPHERPGYAPPQEQYRQPSHRRDDSDSDEEDLAYGVDSPHSSRQNSRHQSYSSPYPPQSQYSVRPSEPPASKTSMYMPRTDSGLSQPPHPATSYQTPQPYQYAPVPDHITYTARSQTSQQPTGYSQPVPQQPTRKSSQSQSVPYAPDARIVDITPGGVPDRERERRSSKSKSHRSSVDSRPPGLPSMPPPPPSQGLLPQGLMPRMDMLSVGGMQPSSHGPGSGGLPPASPLLEAYHGTYQSISPMPGAMRLPDDDLDDLPPLSPPASSLNSERREKEKKRVKLYDPEADAKAIASAMNHSKVDADVLCEILPNLTHDQILGLHKEYKKQVKIQGKGINLSKHLKMKLTGNFGKVVYVTALGRWESEGYWANFFYQSHSSRRELLVESLMGRTNAEIREIKDSFRDKRYADSLTRCMEKELKMDKFRTAVLMVLEERRQEEQDVYPAEYRDRDVEMLYRAVQAKQGGETAMLEVICRRSDAHLREVMRGYERLHGENFARTALKKSNNLVGEVIAHILNGVINRPARDALLLRHAIRDIAEKNKDDELRYELLISRLVRMHWDRMHLARVKREYKDKYGKYIEDDIDEATKGDFAEFLIELCQTGAK